MVSRTTSVALIGDSLTEEGRWDAWLPEFTVLNFGIGGNTTDNALRTLPEVVEAEPDIVSVLVGTNDLVWRHTPEHIVRNIESLLVQMRKLLPNAQILVQSLLPRSAEFADAIQEVNRHLRQFSPAVKAQYLDLWPALSRDNKSVDDEFSEDALHLNEAGYQAWVVEFRAALDSLRGVPPSSRPIPVIRR